MKATTRTVTRTATAHVTAPAGSSVTTRDVAPAPQPQPQASTLSQSAVTPVVNLNSKTAPTASPTAASASHHDETLPIAAGAILALLAIGGGAAAIARRRREEEWVEQQDLDDQPAQSMADDHPTTPLPIAEEQPAIVAPSAFAWGNSGQTRSPSRIQEPMVEDERKAGESWVERAYRGPSPSNPSVSLKMRLRRAAFFDKREREAAAGLAVPVDPKAGLPTAMTREQEPELA